MKEGNDGFVRADHIDLESLDEQLERHFSRVWTMDKNKRSEDSNLSPSVAGAAVPTTTTSLHASKPTSMAAATAATAALTKDRREGEIYPSNLVIKGVIAHGTFGTVHRGVTMVSTSHPLANKTLPPSNKARKGERSSAAWRRIASFAISSKRLWWWVRCHLL
ncbi:unnamed protein product [Linum trigynum]|uniref:Uncharacterized protein n=1 Tax=Linum trigynum TaxID=586398 RepID=A0AAV2CUV3_9ROSI